MESAEAGTREDPGFCRPGSRPARPPVRWHPKRREVIRSGAEVGLVLDVTRFKTYRDRRNITSHTYNRAKAEEVYKTAIVFSRDAGKLLEALRGRPQ